MLSGDNSILNKAGQARDESIGGQEKESVELAYISAAVNNLGGNVTAQNLQDELDSSVGKNKTTVTEAKALIVKFEDTENEYTVSQNGIATQYEKDQLEGLTTEEKDIAAINGITEKNIKEVNNENLKNPDKFRAVLTGDVPIPQDTKYISGTIDTGVVILYKNSEFVWIPVPVTENNLLYAKGTSKAMAKITSATGYSGVDDNGRTNYESILYDFGTWIDEDPNTGEQIDGYYMPYSTSRAMTSNYGLGTSGWREPDIVSDYGKIDTYLSNINLTSTEFKKELQENYNIMIESVSKYGGFFVGRYETSIDNNTVVASKKGVMPMSANTNSQMWYGMYDKQKKFTNDADKMQSSMIWGSQYDAMLNWMQSGSQAEKINGTTNGNHSKVLKNTGATETDVINNIYDLEGNLFEWTLEAHHDKYRAKRGGDFHSSLYAASSRDSKGENSFSGSYPSAKDSGNGTRLSLYIK